MDKIQYEKILKSQGRGGIGPPVYLTIVDEYLALRLMLSLLLEIQVWIVVIIQSNSLLYKLCQYKENLFYND
ncbi:hypothetical protein P8452_10512 [Trifolium repens]|nr:hypothetical protein P8452_10512 [Trifolium repens]